MKRGQYKKIVKFCAHCGVEFEGTARAKYCSRSHSVLAARKRQGCLSPWSEVDEVKVDLVLLIMAVSSPQGASGETKKVVSSLMEKYKPLLSNEGVRNKLAERLRAILKP